MTYDLYLGDRTYSSWSLRGWLLFQKFAIPHRTHMVGLYSGTMARDLAELAPAQLVPVMRMSDGTVVGDTLAMAETLAERHPDAGLWPADPKARAMARWMVAEMHSGFAILRSECPMQLLRQYSGFAVSDALRADLDRLEMLWERARTDFGGDQPWLFGNYSIADTFFAPVAARIAGFDLPVGTLAAAYTAAHMTDPDFRKWRAEGLKTTHDPEPYIIDLPASDWPYPE